MSDVDLDLLRSWEGREESREDVITLAPVQMLAATLDRDPAARPLENPYHVLRHLERDARLRSSYHEERARLYRETEPVVVDFATAERMDRQVHVEEPLAAEWQDAGYLARSGALRFAAASARPPPPSSNC